MKTILLSDNHLWALYHFRGRVIRSFLNEGYRVLVLAPESNDINDDNSIPGVEYIPIKLSRTNTGLFENVKYFYSLCKIYKRLNPDIIFHYTIKPILFGSIAAKLNHIPSVSMFTGLGHIFKKESLINNFARKLLKFGLRFPKNIIFLNKEDMNFLITHQIVTSDKSFLFDGGEGLDTSYYKPTTYRKINDHLVFIMVARILYEKGYKEYRAAAIAIKKNNPTAEFILCGEIDSNHPSAVPEDVVIQDNKAGIITYKGRVDNVCEIIQKCDCFVLPSYYNEGMNRSLMEALSIGIPIITTDNNGCREMVIDGITGFLVKKQDTNSLVNAMTKFCSLTDEEKNQMGQEARKLAINRFSDEIVINNYLKIIDKIF
jgi:glycosyltransferase involved in cell wall biosynthesis